MRREKFISVIFISFFILTGSLFAQQSDNSPEQDNPDQTEQSQENQQESKSKIIEFLNSFNKIMNTIYPLPILSIEFGMPETISFDIGIKSLFIQFNSICRGGAYFCYSKGSTHYDTFNRFSIGMACGIIYLIEFRGGTGYGFMKKDNDLLHIFFTEFGIKFSNVEIMMIFETPLAPTDLVQYYRNTYDKGFKAKIGISL